MVSGSTDRACMHVRFRSPCQATTDNARPDINPQALTPTLQRTVPTRNAPALEPFTRLSRIPA